MDSRDARPVYRDSHSYSSYKAFRKPTWRPPPGSAPKWAPSAPAMTRSPGPRSCGARAVHAPGALRTRVAASGGLARPRVSSHPPLFHRGSRWVPYTHVSWINWDYRYRVEFAKPQGGRPQRDGERAADAWGATQGDARHRAGCTCASAQPGRATRTPTTRGVETAGPLRTPSCSRRLFIEENHP